MIRYIALLHFSVILLYLYLAFYIFTKNAKDRLNQMAAFLFICFAIWTISVFFHQNIKVSEQSAVFWIKVCGFGWCSFPYALLWTTLLFTGRNKKIDKWYIYVVTFIPSMIFTYKQLGGAIICAVERTYYGWGMIWSDSIWFYAFTLYYTGLIIVILYILWDFMHKTTIDEKRKQAVIIFVCTIIAAIFIMITDVLFQKIRFIITPNIGSIIALVWAFGFIFAMIKYKFLEITPATAASKILSTMTDSLILVGPNLRILDVNKYTLDLLGYKKENLLGEPFKCLFIDDGSDLPLSGDNLKKLLKNSTIRDYDAEYKTKDGEKIPVSFSASISRDQEKNLAGIVCIARDMREMLRLTRKEQDLAVELAAKKIEERKSIELKNAYNELKSAQSMLVKSEKLREMGQLGAGVAHELNNPLSGVLSLMRTYKGKYGPNSLEFEDLEEMEKGFEFMSEIVKSLSDFTRESFDAFIEIDCNKIIEATINLVATQLETKNIKIETDICSNSLKILGDRRQLQQVVLNLINNSREALFDGGIVRLKTRNVKKDGKGFAEIIVEDTGIGIKSEAMDEIFTPFFTTKRLGGGVGLGLSVVHSIVKAHEGNVFVKSVEGKGSTFVIRIPAIDNIS